MSKLPTQAWNKAKTSKNGSFHAWKYSWRTQRRCVGIFFVCEADGRGGGGERSYFRVLTTCKARVLRESYRRICVLIMSITSKTIDQRFWEGTKNIAVQGGTVSHDNISEIRKFIGLCRFSDIVCGFLFLLNNFPLQSFEYAPYSCV